MQLMDIKEIKGEIILKTGLHIGAGDMEMHIGGTDNPVIKHPHTQEPYIPGSSLKGKVRSLLEMESGLMVRTEGKPLYPKLLEDGLTEIEREKCLKILKIFGCGGSESDLIQKYNIGPTRVSFADCHLNATWKQDAANKRWNLVEVKSENSINRIQGVAQNPRFTERVPAGAKFDFFVTLKLLEPNEGVLFEYLLGGLKLLELDALGGSGSRGYGRIQFNFEDESLNERFKTLKPF